MRHVRLLFALLAFSAVAFSQQSSGKWGTYSANIVTSWNGLTRYYDAWVPVNVSPTPDLWIVLHPTVANAAIPPAFDKQPMLALADTTGAVVVWPVSTYNSHSWYWDSYFLDYTFTTYSPDDSGYIRSLILQFESQYPIAHVWVIGMSSGGFMAHRVCVESSDLVSGCGMAAAQLYAENSANIIPLPLLPVSVIMVNGDLDNRVGYCGQAHEWGSASSPSSDVTFDYWAQVAGYTDILPQLCTGGTPTVGVNGALIQSNGVTVEFVREVNVGHVWVPGTEAVMWQFFQTYGRTAP